MTWNYEKAQARVQKGLAEAPTITTQRYADQYLPTYNERRAMIDTIGGKASPPLVNLEKSAAVLVDTVQIYISILGYDDFRLSDGRETEASHERALRFLHLYYAACDRVVEGSIAQRVDFHGGRLHAVVLDDTGTGISANIISEALKLVHEFQVVAARANKELASSEFSAEFRIGVDTGPCVAINNGTGLEQEPMFLGSAANHAAKLAEGQTPGLYVSDRVRQKIQQPEVGGLDAILKLDDSVLMKNLELSRRGVTGAAQTPSIEEHTEQIINNWRSGITSKTMDDPTIPKFSFFHKVPPMKDINFEDISPSKSIRMEMVSLFADLSSFTDYIDQCIGRQDVSNAVRALYVIRAEFQAVVEQDFGGRKIRFIGDCIQAVLAEGDRTSTHGRASVTKAVECAGGIRSSFEVCQSEIKDIDQLGLAIGLEIGHTPISRIGIRGDRSVRVASSVASTESEKLQTECAENETRVGSRALRLAPSALLDLFDENGASSDLHFDDVATGLSAPAVVPGNNYEARAHTTETAPVARAHFQRK